MATAALATAIITSIFTVDGRETAPPALAFHARPPAVLEEQPALPPAPIRSTGTSTGMGAGCSSGPVHDLIVADFTPIGEVDTALYIASRESGCNPNAKNPNSSASGVFQIVNGTWLYWSDRCGYAGASAFDAAANVAVAACMVEAEGWGPWAL